MSTELPDHLKNISILVVDDMSFYHSLIKQTLVNIGHVGKIHTALSMHEAIAVINDIYNSGSTIDFIFSDYHLQDANGVTFAKKIRSHPILEKIPFVIFSTDDNSKFIVEAINAGVDNYFFKPIDPEVFLEKIVFCWNKRHRPDGITS